MFRKNNKILTDRAAVSFSVLYNIYATCGNCKSHVNRYKTFTHNTIIGGIVSSKFENL